MIETILTAPEKKIYYVSEKKFKKHIKNKNTIIDISSATIREISDLKKKIYNKKNIYFLLDLEKINFFSRAVKIILTLIVVKKNPILINKNYINSLFPDFLHKFKINSYFLSFLYFFFQLFKNLIIIFFSKKILFKL
tara:strand:- start:347 stop:757 length:411 start_codon:yes stop_codon:yes gene_type:complete